MAFNPSPVLIKRAAVFHAGIGPGTGILPTPIAPLRDPSTFRTTVAISGADATLGLLVTVSGTTHTALLNNGVALSADVLYTFSFSASQEATYDFTLGVGGLGVNELLVEEPTGSLI
jgi:hypothetical protein